MAVSAVPSESLSESPVMQAVTATRERARTAEDQRYTERTAHRKDLFQRANTMLDDGVSQLRGDLEMDERAQKLAALKQKSEANPQDSSARDVYERANASYQTDKEYIEFVALGSRADNDPNGEHKATRKGTKQKVASLYGVMAHLQDRLDRQKATGTADKDLQALRTEIDAMKGVINQLDETLRLDETTPVGRLKQKVQDGISKRLRGRYYVPTQERQSLTTADLDLAMREDQGLRDAQTSLASFADRDLVFIANSPDYDSKKRADAYWCLEARAGRARPDRLRTKLRAHFAEERDQIYRQAEGLRANQAQTTEGAVKETKAGSSAQPESSDAPVENKTATSETKPNALKADDAIKMVEAQGLPLTDEQKDAFKKKGEVSLAELFIAALANLAKAAVELAVAEAKVAAVEVVSANGKH